MNFFELQNIQCGYGKAFSLSGISFSLRKGGFAGIIGPNGSGKSTLFKGIAGELPLLKGEILLNGKSISNMPLKDKAQNIAVVSQFVDSVDITVEEYVLMGRLPYRNKLNMFESKRDLAIARKYMKETGVFDKREKQLNELSGGEQQLASIAKALTQEPQILLLDEPTSHLDITHQVQILDLIQRLCCETGISVLMIIHDLNLAGEYCDYLLMMHNGSLFTKGSPHEVLNYKNIEDVYKTTVVSVENPWSKKPAIFLVSQNVLSQREMNKP